MTGQNDQRDPVPGHPPPGGGRTHMEVSPARLTLGWRQDTAATLDEHVDRYGPLPRPGHSRQLRPGALADAVAAAGLTGRGGASFPTGTKLHAVASGRGPAVVVANGMESEPASQKDRALLTHAPHLVLDGADLAATAVQADVVHICLPRTATGLVDQMCRAVQDRRRSGVGSTPVEVHDVPPHYVSGEETALVRWLNGGEARPVSSRQRPFERGVRRRPTLIDNVETLAHIALIGRFGPAWFRQAGLADAPGTMLATVSGAVRHPGVYELAVGTPIGALLTWSRAAPDASAVLIGGYFGTWHEARSAAGIPMSPQWLGRAGASPGAGVLIVLPAAACGLTETARVLGYLAGQSAGQCGPCAFGLPAIAADFADLASGRAGVAGLERLERRFGVLTGRGACRHPDGAVRLAASALTVFAADARAHAGHLPCAPAQAGAAGGGVLPVPRPWAEGEWE
ncbi:MAG TPA: NADH-ubiquinone oxidoreductase-F iron-sulfur binding region domain-containing protein [Streptosporangiaceae bacterium]